jgi:DNA-binding CsgD family transcriptional regulator
MENSESPPETSSPTITASVASPTIDPRLEDLASTEPSMPDLPDLTGLEKGVLSTQLNGQDHVELPTKTASRQHANLTIRGQKVQDYWLDGYQAAEIAVILEISIAQVSGDIRRFRRELYANNQASLEEHAEQTVAIMRRLQARLWSVYDEAVKPSNKVQIIQEIRKSEEAVAKVRGLITNKVIANVLHEIKLHDFKDTFPAPKVIEGTAIPIDEPARILENGTTDIPDASYDVHEYRTRPDYEDDENLVALPDGTMIDVNQ